MELSTRLTLGKLAPPPSRTTPQNPLMNSYAARGGEWFWLMGAEADRHWPGIRVAADDPRPDDERFATARGRRAAAEFVAILDEIFAGRTRAEWAQRFEDNDVWWTPVNSAADVLTDPQARAAGVFVDVPAAGSEDGQVVSSLATPVEFGAGAGPTAPPPAVGDDTDSVLRELGIGDDELERLRAEGIVHGAAPDTRSSAST